MSVTSTSLGLILGSGSPSPSSKGLGKLKVMPTRTPLLLEALQVRRQSDKERMAKRKPSATFGAARAAKWLWQQERKKWSREHPQYIFRKGKLIFVPPEKRRQLKSKIKGRVVQRASLPGSGHRG